MQKLILIIFAILITSICYGQKTANEIFEASKGKWELPVKKYKEVFDNEEMNHYPAYQFDSTLRILTDSAYEVKALHAGEVVLATEIDSLKFIVLVKFGDYYVSYNPLQSLSVKNGDKIDTDKVIGILAKDLDDNFNLEISLHFKEKELCAKDWINWKKSN